MTALPSQISNALKLELADGQRWLIRPADDRAAVTVAELGKAMSLGVAGAATGLGEGWRQLCVVVCAGSKLTDIEASGAVVCRLPSAEGREADVGRMRRVASQIAREAMSHGGLLLHGALAEYQGSGFVMAGPQEVGKSTASRRLPFPWRSLSDDMTLVVRDGDGRIWAHPWPTWSRFLYGGTGGTWAVERAVPLRAIFFLDQSPIDQLEPVHRTQAAALLMASTEELTREVLFVVDDIRVAHALCGEALGVVKRTAAEVPAFSLKLSLDGQFWEKIASVLPTGGGERGTTNAEQGTRTGPATIESVTADDTLRVVCTGTSMSPTLGEPDLLEVNPYVRESIRAGDVVYFKSPDTGTMVVHRVASVGARKSAGRRKGRAIRTRGDNNLEFDEVLLEAGDVVGRVTTAQRGARRRVVHGGFRGVLVERRVRLARGVRKRAGGLLQVLYRLAAAFGPLDRLLPRSIRPRPVLFATRYRGFLKLLMGRQAIGHYDSRHQRWYIRRRFRLFVNERMLAQAAASAPTRRMVLG